MSENDVFLDLHFLTYHQGIHQGRNAKHLYDDNHALRMYNVQHTLNVQNWTEISHS